MQRAGALTPSSCRLAFKQDSAISYKESLHFRSGEATACFSNEQGETALETVLFSLMNKGKSA